MKGCNTHRGGRGSHWASFGPFGHRMGGGHFGPGGGRGDFDGSGPRGSRRGKRFAGEELRLMVLGLLAQDSPQHGYQLIRAFAEKSGDAYSPSPGVLYPLLTLLADMDLVTEVAGEGSARRSYALSEAGRTEVETRQEAIDALFARLAALGEDAGRANAGPVRRAMMNLRTASIQRLTREGTDAETGFAIAAILDEAAQKIERL